MTVKEKKNFIVYYNREVNHYLELCKYNELNSDVVVKQDRKISHLRYILLHVLEHGCRVSDDGRIIEIT